jgi:hypothetical protein
MTILYISAVSLIWMGLGVFIHFRYKRLRREDLHILTEMSLRLQNLQIEYDAICMRSGEYFKVITGAQAERDTWRSLYQKSSISAGNAQNRLLLEREQNLRIMQANNIRPFRDSTIDLLVGAYNEEHYQPVKESLGEPKKDPSPG